MKRLLRVLKWVVIVLVVVFIGIQFYRPPRTNPPIDPAQTIEAHTQMTPDVASILDRSCRDCHSNKTVWPWYTQVAPVSWWLVDHVNDGRHDMNYSEWGKLPRDRQDRKLRQICDEITDGQMPLSSYLPMHPAARLSEQDKKTLCDWTDAERERLSGQSRAGSPLLLGQLRSLVRRSNTRRLNRESRSDSSRSVRYGTLPDSVSLLKLYLSSDRAACYSSLRRLSKRRPI